MRNFLLDSLRYRDSNQCLVNADCNRINGSFDKIHLKVRIQALFRVIEVVFELAFVVQSNLVFNRVHKVKRSRLCKNLQLVINPGFI